jgi:hypothetical protein
VTATPTGWTLTRPTPGVDGRCGPPAQPGPRANLVIKTIRRVGSGEALILNRKQALFEKLGHLL